MTTDQSFRESICAYAFDDSPPPSQDHELMLITLGINDLLLELAANNSCPKQEEFLSCLYLLAGDAVMTNGESTTLTEAEELITLAKRIRNPLIRIWIKQSEQLLNNPQEFDYNLWCGSELARKSIAEIKDIL